MHEIVSASHNALQHANGRLPHGVDRVLRRVVVTPALHRVHHSPDSRETDSNFGNVPTWWDRLLGTYREWRSEADATARVRLDDFRARGAPAWRAGRRGNARLRRYSS